jgi:hypothetical protein
VPYEEAWFFHVGLYRNVRRRNWTEHVEDSANMMEFFVYGFVADARDVVRLENHALARTHVEN